MTVKTAFIAAIVVCIICIIAAIIIAIIRILSPKAGLYQGLTGFLAVIIVIDICGGAIIIGFDSYFSHQKNIDILSKGQSQFEELYISNSPLDSYEKDLLDEYTAAYHKYKDGIAQHPWQCEDIGEFPRYYLSDDGRLEKKGERR